ncbi:glycosyltransferase family 2 protein [Aerophototrophica crusticola]|uniref:Glycosyltransferase family 2 protein n=1 Tax=Aerophototrophica crusticola TaxID=1709002 RepID=A0A858R6X5_9PROT|nr:glycosyltransferase family 2 protein [Rhodospirillaceae bacterium B3]
MAIPTSDPTSCVGPDVDIIILSYNRTQDTIAAVESALAQQGVAPTVILFDQNSTADCIDTIQARFADEPRVRIHRSPRNLGVAGGRNAATRLGSSRYVVALDNDAIFEHEDTVALAVGALEKDATLAVVAFRVMNYFNGEDDWQSWCYPAALKPQAAFGFEATQYCGCSHAIRRAAFEQVGGYDESLFFLGEEKDLSYRLINAGYRLRYLATAVVRHKVQPEKRVAWTGGRYFYAVRNSLYMEYKFGTSAATLAMSAAAWTLKGAYNGLVFSALRGVAASVGLAARYRQAGRNPYYRLAPTTRQQIQVLEKVTPEPLGRKIRRQFVKLSGHRDTA